MENNHMSKEIANNLDKVVLSLQSQYWQDLYKIYTEAMSKKDANLSDAKQLMINYLQVLGFTSVQSFKIANMMIYCFKRCQLFQESGEDELFIAQSDLEYLISIFPSQFADAPDHALDLLISFVSYARTNHHPSGWIKYDRKIIFYLAGLNKMPAKSQERLCMYLHNHLGLEIRVIGSNQPIPCFNINWLKPISDDNKLVAIGSVDPSSIAGVIKIIKK